MSAWHVIDLVLAAVLLLSVLLGVMRGALLEVLSLAGWLAAWLAAQWFGEAVAALLPVGKPGSPLNLGAGYVACFILALLVWRLLSWLLHQIMRASPLSGMDRALGAVFGLLRGLLLVLMLVMLVDLTPLARAETWRQSVGVQVSQSALRLLAPLLPGDWAAQAGQPAKP
jgi:membrane protein required for colicin V production